MALKVSTTIPVPQPMKFDAHGKPMPSMGLSAMKVAADLATKPDQTAWANVGQMSGGFAKADHKPEPVQSIAQPLTEVEALADELLGLEAKIIEHEMGKVMKRREEIRKALVEQYEGADPEATLAIERPGGSVIFSPCSQQFEVTDKPGLVIKLGSETAFEIAKFGVTDLKKVLSENELAKFGKKVYASRTMKVGLKS